MSLIKNGSFTAIEEKALCSKCKSNLKREYHSWCQECFNEYAVTRKKADIQLGAGDYIYYIVNTDTKIIVYTGASNSIVIRKKCHLDWLTSNFGKAVRAINADTSKFKMYVLDLSELELTKEELRAIEHQHNYSHKDTVINTDIRITDKDMDILQELENRGILDILDTLEYIEYNEFISKKNKLSECESESLSATF